MKRHIVTVLTGLTAASLAVSAPASVFAAETNDCADPFTEEAQSLVSEETSMVVSEPTINTEQRQNDDGSVTTTTTTTVTETTTTEQDPLTETSEVKEGDEDYIPITDENGDTLLPYERTITTPQQEVSSETVTTVTETTEKTQMTNQVDTESTEVSEISDDGEQQEASDDVAEKANNLLEAQNITSDFDVYGDTLDESIGHVDGNVAVNNVATGSDVTIMNKEQHGSEENNHDYAEDGYSYIGNTNGSRIGTNSNQTTKDPETGETKNASLLVTGQDAEVTDTNSGHANMFARETAELDENGNITKESAEELAKKDSRLQNISQVADINNNLDKIGNAGQALIDATKDDKQDYTVDDDIKKFNDAIRMISDTTKAIENKVNVLTISIKKTFLTDTNQTGKINDINNALRDIVMKNETGTKVIVNVDTEDDSDIEVTGMMANIQAYTAKAAHLFWNFGNFAGKLHFNQAWGGTILASKATVRADAGIQSGRVVAKTVGHKSGELHMAVSGARATTKTTSAPKITRSGKTTVTISSPNPSISYKYRKQVNPEQPDKPDTPEKPNTPPATPDEPNTPETPEKPETPDKPNVPDTPKNPEAPKTPEVPHSSGSSEIPDTPSTPEIPPVTPEGPTTPTPAVEESADVQEVESDEFVPHTGSDETPIRLVYGKARPRPQGNDTPALTNGQKRQQVATGDSSNLPLYGCISAAALCGLAIFIAMKKRKH